MALVLTRDGDEFAVHAAPLFESRLECNLLATVLLAVRRGQYPASDALFAYADDQSVRDGVQLAALRVPPHPLLISYFDPVWARTLVDGWIAQDWAVPGVIGPGRVAHAVASAWEEVTGEPARCAMRQSLHAADAIVDPPRPPSGVLRPATRADQAQVIEWMRAFSREALGRDDPGAARSVAAGVRGGEWFVWEDGGEPVSLVRANARVAGVVRIGPVYTPPRWRRRGYAGIAVATASHRAMTAGARRCAIITDLANPTSNHVYANVGYRPVMDLEEYTFKSS